ncbi:hypothetical protein J3R30DRAFT_3694565 [Lentinula aciculospora]|uniref:Alpha-L-arabinofuranosidase 1 catalytic domain-containing protein n=1 Tax=Lentinula aciculospora TaxID=153920 RepID=A0A9W9AUP9_9AGAR|nr:hypothetical protein J3R30DRAFT_3694565 [Lentinula aciculospora]
MKQPLLSPLHTIPLHFTLEDHRFLQAPMPSSTTALTKIKFVIGDARTKIQATIRASMGHLDPFTLNCIEIGNEDFLSSTTTDTLTIAGQISTMLNMLNSLNFVNYIATSAISGNVPSLSPAPTYWDLHIYSDPTPERLFINGAFNFDVLSRNGLQFFMYATGHYPAFSIPLPPLS